MKGELIQYIESLKLEKDREKLKNIQEFKKYFEQFFKTYPIRNIPKLCRISFEEVIYSLILVKNPYNIIKCLKILDTYHRQLFTEEKNDRLVSFMKYLTDEAYRKLVDDYNHSFSKTSQLVWMERKGLFDLFSKKDFLDLSCFLHDNPRVVSDLRPFLIPISPNDFMRAIFFYDNIDLVKEYSKIDKKLLEKILKKMFKVQDEGVIAIIDYGNYLYSSYSSILNEVNKEVKRIHLVNKQLEQLMAKLNVEGAIEDIDSILSLCKDEKMQDLVVDYIISVNRKYDQDLWKQYQSLRVSNDENLEYLLQKYGYTYAFYSEQEKEQLKSLNYDYLEQILDMLLSLQIHIREKDLLLIDLTKLQLVNHLLEKGILTYDFVQNYPSILYDEDLFRLVRKNIDLLVNSGVNIANYGASLDILLCGHLEENLEVLKIYGLTITKDTMNLEFLSQEDLNSKIDFLIEAGYYEELIISLDYLNYFMEELYTIKLFEQLNITNLDANLYSSSSLLLGSEFVDSKYLEQLKSSVEYQASLPNELVCYQTNSVVLMIHNVLVSIPRLLNNLSKFTEVNREIILACILYKGHYTLDEIETLSITLFPQQDVFMLVRR